MGDSSRLLTGRLKGFAGSIPVLSAIFLSLAVLACGPAEEPTPTPVVLQTEGLIPTPTAMPPPPVYTCTGVAFELDNGNVECRAFTPTPPEIVVVTATPPPESPTEAPAPTPTPEPTEPPPPTPTALPTAIPDPTITPTPRPTPTPRYRSVGAPEAMGIEGFKYVVGPTASSLDISFSASIESTGYINPTEIQVWQALTRDDGSCSTERPIAFITKPQGSGQTYIASSTAYSWAYCTSSGRRPVIYSETIPWLAAKSWTYAENERRYNYDPFITGISVKIDLRDDRVEDISYTNPAGYIILVFWGEILLSRVWVDIP